VIKKDLAKYFDHTNLKPFATKADIEKLCNEAKKYGFFSVCVNPSYVRLAKKLLKGSDVKVCTVVGFPLGATTTETKVFETKQAIKNGADEIDMVINIGALKDKDYCLVEEDISEVVKAAKNKPVKVIIECCYLTDKEKKMACYLAQAAGASFVKTSTGFGKNPYGGPNGATLEDVKLMWKAFNGKIKAAGGIRTLEQVRDFIDEGANRLGCSKSVEIMEEFKKRGY